jgi:hypothetical protein
MKLRHKTASAGGRRTRRAILASAFVMIALAATPAFASAAAWTFQYTPYFTVEGKPHEYGDRLYDISCLAANACTAVGKQGVQDTLLAEYWNGTAWKVQPAAEQANVVSLQGVSCSSSLACTAVGQIGHLAQAAAWNGTEWNTQTTPNPEKVVTANLAAVSCSSSTKCMAVGSYATITEGKGLAETWNGTEWKIVSTATPEGAKQVSLRGVSCPSATECIATGSDKTSSGEYTLAELWNGTEWKVQSTPNPEAAKEGKVALNGVSCTSSIACTAVGEYEAVAPNLAPFAERWNGKEWKLQTVSHESGTSSVLSGVSCTSSTACTAVGSSGAGALAEFWNGTEWKIQSTTHPAEVSSASLSGVSCSSSATCSAVGSFYFNEGTELFGFADIYQ